MVCGIGVHSVRYLLREMNNNMGATPRVEYRPSTYFSLKDDLLKATRWKTALPFPVQVVAKVEVLDDVSHGKLTTTYHYRVLQPRMVTDANGNRTLYSYTPLGLLQSIAVQGKDGERLGDTPEEPGTRFLYDFRYIPPDRPTDALRLISVTTIRREHHITESDLEVAAVKNRTQAVK